LRDKRPNRIASASGAGAFALAFAATGALAAGEAADGIATLSDAVANGRFELQLRPRYNRIDESDKEYRSEGTTVRAIAGWKSAPFRGWRLTLEGIHSDHVGAKDFNDDGAQFATSEYPLLPDPRTSGINQANVEYSGFEATRIRLGRQVVRVDDGRWVSDNDFRQTPQLFDGITVVNGSLPGFELLAAHYRRQRNTSGDEQQLRLSLLHGSYNPAPGHALSAYAYFHDQPQNGAFTGFANSSYRVVGARAEGAWATALAFEIPYTAELAQQRPYAGGDPRIDARYWRLGGGATRGDLTLRYDQETKGSNGGAYGLQMPLTDFYAFNGWTLHFFNTPPQGLRDRWFTLRYQFRQAVFFGETHRFRSDFRDLDFGKETDLGITLELRGNCRLRLQHARYDRGSGMAAPQIRKTWLTLDLTY
jgi:hypothetical protein